MLPSDEFLAHLRLDYSHLPKRANDELERLDETLSEKNRAVVYGSLYTGLSVDDEKADLDITFPLWQQHRVSLDSLVDRRGVQLKQLRAVAKKLRGADYYEVVVRDGARVPVVTCLDPKTSRRIEITIGNHLAVRNSMLLRSFALFPVCRLLVQRVKEWAVREQLLRDRTNGLLPSYVYTLWVVCFLQIQGRIPNLVMLDEEPDPACMQGGDVKSALATARRLVADSDIDILYSHFMKFLLERIEREAMGQAINVLSVRDGGLGGPVPANRYSFAATSDPYAREHGQYTIFRCQHPEKLRSAIRREAEGAAMQRRWKAIFPSEPEDAPDGPSGFADPTRPSDAGTSEQPGDPAERKSSQQIEACSVLCDMCDSDVVDVQDHRCGRVGNSVPILCDFCLLVKDSIHWGELKKRYVRKIILGEDSPAEDQERQQRPDRSQNEALVRSMKCCWTRGFRRFGGLPPRFWESPVADKEGEIFVVEGLRCPVFLGWGDNAPVPEFEKVLFWHIDAVLDAAAIVYREDSGS